MIRRGLALLAVLALVPVVEADDAGTKKVIKGLVEKMQTATIKEDYAVVVDLTHPKALEQLGGKEKALDTIKNGMKALKEGGLTIKSLKSGEPATPVPGGKELYTVVPTTLELTTPDGKVTSNGFVVGASADGGKTWTFVDGSPGPDAIRKLLPDLPEKLVLPKPEIKITKD